MPASAQSVAVSGELGRGRARRPRSEQALIRGAQAGSEADLEALFHRFWPRAYRAAFLIVHDHAAAEDIAQEAFLAAIRRLDRFDRRRRFGHEFSAENRAWGVVRSAYRDRQATAARRRSCAWSTWPPRRARSRSALQPEADLQRDLEVVDRAVFLEVAADLGHLEPVEMPDGLPRPFERVLDRVVERPGGRSDDLAD
jgi:RNA polymerase sigma factor (sigma-70 family)